MKTILKFAIILLLAGNFTCAKEKENDDPIEIPITEYSLAETSCRWTNLDYDGKVIIINSNAKLEKYITCMEGSFPEIDFSKNTLLLARGGCGARNKIITTFFQYSTNKYTLDVKIYSSILLPAVTTWSVSILVPKIPNNAIVILDIKETYS
jgi:hypothetical protein